MPNASHEQYSANPFFLASLSGLIARQAIVVEHSLTAADGSILLQSGLTLQDRHVQALPQQLLRSPLEASLALPDFAAHALLQDQGRQLLSSQPLLHLLLEKTAHRHACLAVLENLPLNHSLSMLLAMLDQQALLEHSLLCCLLSLGLALRTGQSSILLEQIALAALFHDIGELYLRPRSATPQSGSKASQWRHRMAHPLIGYRQMLQLGPFAHKETVALAILQHHERLDGSGYPRREKEKQLCVAGQIIAVADMATQLLLHKSHPYQRLDIALRIIPGEFHRPSVSLLNRIVRQLDNSPAASQTVAQAMDGLHTLLKHIGTITHLLLNLQEEKLSHAAQAALSRCMSQFDGIQRSLFSTGMQSGNQLGLEEDLQLEIMLASQEINWRLRNLGRDLSLTQDRLAADDSILFQDLCSTLLDSPLADG
jgi:hypothetical protein